MSAPHPLATDRKVGLRMAFQPIVEAASDDVFAYEALVRGSEGESAASVLAMVTPATRRAFDRACRISAIERAVAAGINDTHALLAINFLPDTVDSASESGLQTAALAESYGLSPRRLMFEFGRNERYERHQMAEIIRVYRRCGFTTVMDDFDGEPEGLGVLRDLLPDFIKLDMQLVGGIANSWSRRLVVERLVGMARGLGIGVIAEGIESAADVEKLRTIGIRYFQGYHVGAPALDVLPKPNRRALQVD